MRAAMRMGLTVAVAGAILLGLWGQTRAAEGQGWVGQKVITKYGTNLRVGGRVVDDAGRGKALARGKDSQLARVYRVTAQNGKWLGLQSEGDGANGWVLVSEVVLLENAVDYYTDEIRTNPSASAYIRRGVEWDHREEYDIAISDFNEDIRLDPGDAVAYINRGIAWSSKQEYDKAIKDYDQAIRLDPGFAVAYVNRGVAWRDKQEYDKAIKDYDQAIRLDPGYASAYHNRGYAWSCKQEYDKAIKDYDQAIRLDPGYASAYLNRGIARYLGERGGVVEDCRKVIELKNDDRLANYAILIGYFAAEKDGDEATAKALLEDARAEREVWPYPIITYLRGEMDEKALMDASTNDDKRTETHCFLGMNLEAKGDRDGAREHYTWVVEKGNKRYVEFDIARSRLAHLPAAQAAGR